MAKAAEENVGPIGTAVAFGRESWAELKKVHAPTRQETTSATISVFGMVVLFAILLGLIDFTIGSLMTWFLSLN